MTKSISTNMTLMSLLLKLVPIKMKLITSVTNVSL